MSNNNQFNSNNRQQQDKNYNTNQQQHPIWINSLIRHRHHHSLDSSFNSSNLNQQEQQYLTEQQQQFTSILPINKRSSSLSIDHQFNNPTESASSTPITYPTDNHSSTSNTIDYNLNQANKPKRSQSKLSLVTAIPASILKKDKPGLLSQEQKRANHIASEQKRRAAIRQGYSRLCLIVPSLRTNLATGAVGAGIEETAGVTIQNNFQHTIIPRKLDDDSPFDDQTNLLPLNQDGSNSSTNNAINFKRKRNKQLPFESNKPAPRSEAVVLAKTVEYLRELETERNFFLEKLQKLKAIAISKGIQLSNNNRQQGYDRANRQKKENSDDQPNYQEEISAENDHKLEVWEDKWYGNIQQIDLKLNYHQHDLKSDHHNLQNLDLSLQHLSLPPSTFTNAASFISNSSVY